MRDGETQWTWQQALVSRARTVLAYRHLPLVLAGLAIVLTLPSVTVGWVVDDYFHRATLVGSKVFDPFVDSRLDLFRFLDGDPRRTHGLIDIGFLPWWTDPTIKAAFWRPLTAVTHWVDYRLWPNTPAMMHVHNLAWFGGLIVVVASAYRRFVSPAWVAGVAGLLYAIDDAHGMPVGFLANRNVLVSGLFGVLAIVAHDRWRRDGWRAGAVVGPLLLAVSLLAKEAGLATCGYLFAHACFLERGPWRRQLGALLPYAAVVIVWRSIWSGLGYGFANAGLYVDPLGEPLRYAAAVIERVPHLLSAQWAGPPGEILIMLRDTGIVPWLWCGGVVFSGVLLVLLWPLLRTDRTARFWAVGMALSLLPISATFPADRLLFFVGFGATPLLACLLQAAFGRAVWRPPSRVWRGMATAAGVLFVLVHLILAPVLLPVRAAYPAGPKYVEQFYVRVPFGNGIADQDLILVNPPSVLHTAYVLPEREFAGLPVPRRVRQLATSLQPLMVHRPDERTLVIRPQRGFLSWAFERLFRNEQHPLRTGDRIELTGMTVEVLSLTDDTRPAEAAFRFTVPLEHASLRWLWWKDGEYLPFTPPAVGTTVELDPGQPR